MDLPVSLPGYQRRQIAVIVFLLLAAFSSNTVVKAGETQQTSSSEGWSEPLLIYETNEAIDTPYVFSDRFGVTHIWWREYQRETTVSATIPEMLYYMNNSHGVWSDAVDVIAMTSAVGPTGAVDNYGVVHAGWVGPLATLFHTTALTSHAESAANWSAITAIDTSNLHAHLANAPDGTIHLVYPGRESSGVFYTRYDSLRDVWTAPSRVAPAARLDVSADYASIAIGTDGLLHVVWSEFRLPEGWPPTGVYYSQSNDEGITWSEPLEIAGVDHDQINIAVTDAGQVHVAWNGQVAIGGRYHRWSADNGQTWSERTAVIPPGKGGTEGPPQLQIDNANVVHMLTTFDGCAWHVSWDSGRWSQPVCISGPKAMASNWIEQPALALYNGNELHALFWDDRARLWHTTQVTGAPPIYEVFPTPEVVQVAVIPGTTLSPTVAVTPTSMPEITSVQSEAPQAVRSLNVGRSVTVATLSASIFVSAIFVVHVARSRQGGK